MTTTAARARAEVLNREGMVIGLKNNDFVAAILKFSAAIEADPSFVEAYNNKGNCHRYLGEIDEAIEAYTTAIELDPDFLQAYLYRAYVYLEKNNPNLSALAVRDFERLADNGGNLLFSHTLEFRGLENIVPILKPQLQVLGLYPLVDAVVVPYDPQSVLKLIDSGDKALARQDVNGAIEFYSQVIAQTPEFTNIYYKRGLLYLQQRRFDRAVVDFTRTLRRDALHVEAFIHRAQCLTAMGKHAEAIKDYDNAIALRADVDSWYMARGKLHNDLENYDEALRDFHAALDCNPKNVEAFVHIGTLLSAEQEYHGAVEAYSTALVLNADLPEVYVERAVALERLGEYAAALDDLEHYQRLGHDAFADDEVESMIQKLRRLSKA